MSESLERLLAGQKIIPVVAIEEAENAVPLARALVRGGIRVIEVTLRTAEAVEAIRRTLDEVPEICVGVGTVLSPSDFEKVQALGARFAVSPGATPSLFNAAKETGLPFLPGISTPSEAMLAMEQGFQMLKFFPAVASGGAGMLKGMGGPLQNLQFCPTGGVSEANLAEFLSLKNVFAVGGTWIAPNDLINANDWGEIEARARQASKLVEKL